MVTEPQFRQALAQQKSQLQDQINRLTDLIMNKPKSAQDMLDEIRGRRVFYNLCGAGSFTIADNGKRGSAISMTVSQDGPFIMTHYPVVMWKANLPTNADNYGFWSSVYTWPLPTQQVGSNTDYISLSYEMIDSGSQRNFQNQAAPPILSYPGNLCPLPIATLFAPNTTIQFVPTYEDITFATNPSVDTTGGSLVVGIPGYRIVSL